MHSKASSCRRTQMTNRRASYSNGLQLNVRNAPAKPWPPRKRKPNARERVRRRRNLRRETFMDASTIGKRAWSYAGVLMAAGLSNVEYVEQLTMLLFLKMADQLTEEPYNQAPIIPPELGWKALLPLNGADLEKQYSDSIEKLALKPGMLGV